MKYSYINTSTILPFILFLFFTITIIGGCSGNMPLVLDYEQRMISKRWPNAKRTPSGLAYIVHQAGQDAEKPWIGATITAHYTGTLIDGTKFDSSYDRGAPLKFRLGRGEVIKGWDEAFRYMRRGERRTLIIPPNLAYGDKAVGDKIPANSTLIFDVELLDFK